MILIGQTPKLQIDNFLNPLTKTYDVDEDPAKLTEKIIE